MQAREKPLEVLHDFAGLGSPLMRAENRLGKRLRWHFNRFTLHRLSILNRINGRLTVIDVFGTPGDTLLTAAVCRNIKRLWPRISINLLTRNPELVVYDPGIDSINGPEDYFSLWSWYPEILERRNGTKNILSETCSKAGIDQFEYRSRVYLTKDEIVDANRRISHLRRPIITVNVMSREMMKVWPAGHWQKLVGLLADRVSIVQLGGSDEPVLEGVTRLAGTLSLRQSMAVMRQANVHVGSVSFLMHAANGVDVPSVIIYGGRETPRNSGYAENENLYSAVECSPCWLHDSRGDVCPHDRKCLSMIDPHAVLQAIVRQLDRSVLVAPVSGR